MCHCISVLSWRSAGRRGPPAAASAASHPCCRTQPCRRRQPIPNGGRRTSVLVLPAGCGGERRSLGAGRVSPADLHCFGRPVVRPNRCVGLWPLRRHSGEGLRWQSAHRLLPHAAWAAAVAALSPGHSHTVSAAREGAAASRFNARLAAVADCRARCGRCRSAAPAGVADNDALLGTGASTAQLRERVAAASRTPRRGLAAGDAPLPMSINHSHVPHRAAQTPARHSPWLPRDPPNPAMRPAPGRRERRAWLAHGESDAAAASRHVNDAW